jgi:hypothetical protein
MLAASGGLMARQRNPFRGEWRIIASDTWQIDAYEEFGPAYILFAAGQGGELRFAAISATIDYRVESRGGSPIVEFSWAGDDDGAPVSGRGWARRRKAGLVGRLFIHEGDEGEFVATRAKG